MSRFLEKFAKAGVFSLWSVVCAGIVGIVTDMFGDGPGSMCAIFLVTGTLYYIMDV